MLVTSKDAGDIARLAASCGLPIVAESVTFNETGLDFRVGFATATDGTRWVLRIPRRPDVMERARTEARALSLVRPRLPVEVPDWRILADDLIAYPLLAGRPGLTFDPETYEVTWGFDRASPHYPQTLGAALAALHAIEPPLAEQAGLPVFTPETLRAKWRDDLERVGGSFELDAGLRDRWRRWIADESCWPDFTVLIHGDLYAGHVMVDGGGHAIGIIDWTEARVGDPAADMTGHIRAFGEDALAPLVNAYAAAGGRTWPRLMDHCRELHSAHPVAYALYALETGDPDHMAGAQAQLMLGEGRP